MKIVRLSKDSNLTRIDKVFKWFRFSGRGPTGTITPLDTLVSKPVVVAADLTVTGDSADSFSSKKSTWQQIIDSVLSVFILKTSIGTTVQAFATVLQNTTASFTTALLNKLNGIEALAEVNNISDVNATALTDGGETDIHSHAGGGGGPLTLISTTTIVPADAALQFGLTVDKTKLYKLIINPCGLTNNNNTLQVEASDDGGSTYLTGIFDFVHSRIWTSNNTISVTNQNNQSQGDLAPIMGRNDKIEMDIMWFDGVWNITSEYSGAQTALSAKGNGIISIADANGDVDFLNFTLLFGGFDNIVAYFYEVNNDF